jgi:hypothetical protein
VLSTGPLASTTGKLIDPDIEPIYTDETLVGYATPLVGGYSLDIFFVSKKRTTSSKTCRRASTGPRPIADRMSPPTCRAPGLRLSACRCAAQLSRRDD